MNSTAGIKLEKIKHLIVYLYLQRFHYVERQEMPFFSIFPFSFSSSLLVHFYIPLETSVVISVGNE